MKGLRRLFHSSQIFNFFYLYYTSDFYLLWTYTKLIMVDLKENN